MGTGDWRRTGALLVAVAVAAACGHVSRGSDDTEDEVAGAAGGAGRPSTSTGGTGGVAVAGGSAGRKGSTPASGPAGPRVRDPRVTLNLGGEGGEGGEPIVPHLACEAPTELPGGYVACSNHFIHRPAPGICPNLVQRTSDGGAAGESAGDPPLNGECERSEQCGGDPLMFCDDLSWLCIEGPFGFCERGCVEDSDCRDDQICLCGNALPSGDQSPLGHCVQASCKADSECAPGYLCVSSPGDDWMPSFSCQSPDDRCGGDDDCLQNGQAGQGPWGWACSSVNGRRVCNKPSCSP